ncbi:uncharacterized protein LOC108487759 [Gossypium arboreum]|uniref:uncharacterized protein LOC108487759 n=1 Tax=Gossypium arboreum TaxID=29729 RepID=UPI0008193F94|nr:uncharacterized protein LOC108487759 [Gossypium arboreum]
MTHYSADDDALSQARLRILEKVTRPNTGSGGRGGVIGVTPNVAEYWIEVTEMIIDDLDCTPEQKLNSAVSLLLDEAYQWWLTVKEDIQPDHLFWKFFKSAFKESMWEQVISILREQEFSVLVENTKITEEVKRAERQNRDREKSKSKRNPKPSSSVQRPKKKAKTDGPVRAEPPVAPTRLQPCEDCGRRHQGEFWRRPGACLRCGSLEHRIWNCLLRADLVQAPSSGTMQPYSSVATEDIGSTHSYVASIVSGNLGILVESTSSEVIVLSPLGQSVLVSKWYREVSLEVQGSVFLANLIELPFGEFNLMLGMDWLVKHRVSLDCAIKRVVLRTTEDSETIMIGERQNYFANVISALVAEKLVRKGRDAFLAYISVSISGDSTVKDIRIVRDFLDVFLEELPGLPLNRKVEFEIELLPGIAPLSIAPYRMAPKELKAQL